LAKQNWKSTTGSQFLYELKKIKGVNGRMNKPPTDVTMAQREWQMRRPFHFLRCSGRFVGQKYGREQ
jgi:hypothetical protein